MKSFAEPPRVLRSARWATWARDRRVQAGAAAALVLVVAAIGVAATRGGPEEAPAPARASPINEPTAATPNPEGTAFHLVTPGPTVPANHWRWSGSVIDQDGKPLAGVCVHIGPGECRFNSVRTDDQGNWVIDFPQVDVQYDFHFVKDGYQTVDQSVRTQGPGQFQLRMIPQ